MRALLFHCKRYASKITKLSNRPKDIEPEKITERTQSFKNCIVAWVTVEKEDKLKNVCLGLSKEIIKMSKDVGHKNVVILPFAHLSNNLAKSPDGKKAIKLIENELKKINYNIKCAHFGSHKSLLLEVYGHQSNVRYREF